MPKLKCMATAVVLIRKIINDSINTLKNVCIYRINNGHNVNMGVD